MPDDRAVTALRVSEVAQQIRSRRLIAVLRRIEPQARLLDLVDRLAADGVRVFEVTFDAPTAGDDIAAVRDRLAAIGCKDATVGAGTIRDRAGLDRALTSGAAFAVGPIVDVALIELAVDRGVPIIPGAYSPTEIALAWSSGATFVKVFPASSLGPSHVRELRGPLPDIELIATGGLDATNVRSFLDAGCVAVGVGGALTGDDATRRRAVIAAVGA